MLPRRFALHRPGSLAEAFELAARHGDDASVYAGATELMIALKARVLHYDHLIDLKGNRELAAIRRTGDDLVIGALATHHAIATHPLVRALVPFYAALSNGIANIRVRCAGTIGGNLCFAEPHADPPALLAALGARVRLQGPAGTRELAMADFIHGAFETARAADEIMTAVVLPVQPQHAAYRRFGHLERPAVGAAAVVRADGRRCVEARLWLGAIGGAPIRLAGAEAALAGLPTDALTDALAAHAAAEIEAIAATDDIHGSAEYKRHLALVLLRRALAAAVSDAPGRGLAA
jgi:carbon-monoxide dehydrogenase medium subunit